MDGLRGSQFTFHEPIGDVKHAYWMCSVLTSNAKDRDPIREHLAQRGIETRPLFYRVHTMPMYSQKFARFTVAENLGWRGINLPSYPDLSNEDVNYIVESLLSYPFNA